MLMEVNPRVSKRARCSYTTVADFTCRSRATVLCSSCERFACANHVLSKDGVNVCAACSYLFEQVTKRYDDPALIAGIPVRA